MTGVRTARTADRSSRICLDCREPVRWWRNARDLDRWICIDYSSDDSGTVQKLQARDPDNGRRIAVGLVLSGIDLAKAEADQQLLFTLHTLTCSARRAERKTTTQ